MSIKKISEILGSVLTTLILSLQQLKLNKKSWIDSIDSLFSPVDSSAQSVSVWIVLENINFIKIQLGHSTTTNK